MPTFAPNPKPVTEQTPREIDEQLAHWYGEMHEASYYLESAKQAAANAIAREPSVSQASLEARFGERIKTAQARVDAIVVAIKPFNDEFTRRGGWKRYFIVRKGHVHRERSCSTCTYSTAFGWLPELSDCDETKMVETYGDQACAVCFPGVLNHPAFIASARERKAHEERKRAVQCAMSGERVGKTPRTPNGQRAKCPDCGLIVPITKYGCFRQHNPPKQN